MPVELTRHQRLAESLFEARHGRPLSEYVAEKRNARPRWPWTLIAEQVQTDTEGEVQLVGETLRVWYGTDQAEAERLEAAAS